MNNHYKITEVIINSENYYLYLNKRWQIFCKELKRVDDLNEIKNNLNIETDLWDEHSRHFIVSDEKENFIGCFRLINKFNNQLSCLNRYQVYENNYTYIDKNIMEISRFAIDSSLRGGQQIYILLDMYKYIFNFCVENKINYCLAAIEDRFATLLKKQNIYLLEFGPINEMVVPNRRLFLFNPLKIENNYLLNDLNSLAT